MIFPTLLFNETSFVFDLTVKCSVESEVTEFMGFSSAWQMPKVLAASISFKLAPASSNERGNLPMASSCRCLVNAFSPPNFSAY